MPEVGYAGGWGAARLPQVTYDNSVAISNLSNQFKYGAGAPTALAATAPGLFYFRSDTPSTSNQRIYISTAVGVWVGIV